MDTSSSSIWSDGLVHEELICSELTTDKESPVGTAGAPIESVFKLASSNTKYWILPRPLSFSA